MSRIQDIRIGTRLYLAFGAMVALVMLTLGFTLWQLKGVCDATDRLIGEEAQRLALANEWRQNIGLNAQRAAAMVVSREPALEQRFIPLMAETTARISAIQKQFLNSASTPEGMAAHRALGDARERYMASRAKAMKSGVADAAAQAAFNADLKTYLAATDGLVDQQTRQAQTIGQASRTSLTHASVTAIVMMLACVLAATALGVVISRSIVHPLQAAEEAARRIASGDLSVALQTDRRDEAGHLIGSLGAMRESLLDLVRNIRLSTDTIRDASGEVAEGSQDLSARTEQAAASLQQTAAAVEQMNATVGHSAQTAGHVKALSDSAAQAAGRGSTVMTDVIATMHNIETSSQQIADITGLIDSIAFQTNILALNAAVEAARAGAQGRGFAVVASEVRSLAQRSANAAREIKTLIANSNEQISVGARLVKDAGLMMDEINHEVVKVRDMIGEVTTASSEQSDGLGQINAAVTQLDTVTQRNAALVEESAAAAEQLKREAGRLSGLVQVFRLSTA